VTNEEVEKEKKRFECLRVLRHQGEAYDGTYDVGESSRVRTTTQFDESESSRREATGARVALDSRAKAKYDKRTSCALSSRAKATMRTMSSESED
jgi:hypothetical protein